MKTTQILNTILLTILLPAIVSCSPSIEPIKIGAIIPLSGNASQHISISEGMALAIDEVNRYGGINGRPLKMILADSKANPELAKKIFTKIEAENSPHLYISSTSTVSLALAPLAEEHKVVLTGLVVSSPAFTPGRSWSFKYHNSLKDSVLPNLKMLEGKGIKQLGVIYQNDAYGRSTVKIIKDIFQTFGGTVFAQSYETKQRDLSQEIAQLNNLEAIFTIGFVKNTDNVLKQLLKSGYKGIKLAGPSGASLPRKNPELDELYLSAPNIYNSHSPVVEKVKKSYESRFNKMFTHQAAAGYDLIMMLNKLLQNQKITRENIQKVLAGQFSYSGIFGNINKNAGDHDIGIPMFQTQIIDGRLIYLH